jgi:predicted RNA-binding protein YlqC (UPF0109 family)
MEKQLSSANLLEMIVKNLVEKPEDVRVETKDDELGTLLTLHVAPQDMGKVIGKTGTTAGAIRTIIRIRGMIEKKHVNVKIHDPNFQEHMEQKAVNTTKTKGGYQTLGSLIR